MAYIGSPEEESSDASSEDTATRNASLVLKMKRLRPRRAPNPVLPLGSPLLPRTRRGGSICEQKITKRPSLRSTVPLS